MDATVKRKAILLSLATISVIALAAATYGWIQNGSAIFLALAQSGLSWCF